MLRVFFGRDILSFLGLILLVNPTFEMRAYAHAGAKASSEQSDKFSNYPLIYEGIKKGLFDIDEIILRKSNIEFTSCEYVSQVRSVITSYRGVGACVYHLVIESLSTPNRAGFIRAQAHVVLKADHPLARAQHFTKDTHVNIFWSPSLITYSLTSNILRMVREYLVPFMIKNHEDALWGTWLLQFPDHDGYRLFSNKVVRAFARQNWSEVEWVSLSLFPVLESEDPAFYQGMIYLFNHGSRVSSPVYEFYFKTDLPSWNDQHFLDLDGK